VRQELRLRVPDGRRVEEIGVGGVSRERRCLSYPLVARCGDHEGIRDCRRCAPYAGSYRAGGQGRRRAASLDRVASPEELEKRLEALEAAFRIANEDTDRRLTKLLKRTKGDARGERKEPHLPYLIDLAGLTPESAVLDLGCGDGDLARQLVAYLGSLGSYDGLEVQARYVAELAVRFEPLPNFRFHHADLRNSMYNPGGAIDPSTFRFPLGDNTIDLVVAKSLFTHLLPDAAENYFRETSRVLVPNGVLYMTAYLLTEKSLRYVVRTPLPDTPGAFPYGHGVFRTRFKEPIERAIAFDEDWLTKTCARAGLDVASTYYGSWWGALDTTTRQDIVVFNKPLNR